MDRPHLASPIPTPHGRVGLLRWRYGAMDASPLLEVMLRREFPGRIAVVSSFGTESAVLLDLVAAIDPSTPVLFLDTEKLFDETLRYRDAVAARLGLTNIRVLRPEPAALSAADPDGALHRFDPDRCCHLRKVAPLHHALVGFDAWISGRKRFQGGLRSHLPMIEVDAHGRVKINPLAAWTPERLVAHFGARDLPRHPLLAQGYRSIGCEPCTAPVGQGEDARSGRWRGRPKTECGIHLLRPAVVAPA